MRDENKPDPSIVDAIPSDFETAISNFNVGKELMIRNRANRDHKGVDALVFLLEDELSKDDAVVAKLCHIADPKLG